jgi:hypothetical protein
MWESVELTADCNLFPGQAVVELSLINVILFCTSAPTRKGMNSQSVISGFEPFRTCNTPLSAASPSHALKMYELVLHFLELACSVL